MKVRTLQMVTLHCINNREKAVVFKFEVASASLCLLAIALMLKLFHETCTKFSCRLKFFPVVVYTVG